MYPHAPCSDSPHSQRHRQKQPRLPPVSEAAGEAPASPGARLPPLPAPAPRWAPGPVRRDRRPRFWACPGGRWSPRDSGGPRRRGAASSRSERALMAAEGSGAPSGPGRLVPAARVPPPSRPLGRGGTFLRPAEPLRRRRLLLPGGSCGCSGGGWGGRTLGDAAPERRLSAEAGTEAGGRPPAPGARRGPQPPAPRRGESSAVRRGGDAAATMGAGQEGTRRRRPAAARPAPPGVCGERRGATAAWPGVAVAMGEWTRGAAGQRLPGGGGGDGVAAAGKWPPCLRGPGGVTAAGPGGGGNGPGPCGAAGQRHRTPGGRVPMPARRCEGAGGCAAPGWARG